MNKIVLIILLGVSLMSFQAEASKKGFGYIGLNIGMAGGDGVTAGTKSVSNTEVPSSVAQVGIDAVYLLTSDEDDSGGFGLSASYFTFTVEGQWENIGDGDGGYYNVNTNSDVTLTGLGIVYGNVSSNSAGTKKAIWGGYERLKISADVSSSRVDYYCPQSLCSGEASGSLDSLFIKGVGFFSNGWGLGLETRYIDSPEPIYSISLSIGYSF